MIDLELARAEKAEPSVRLVDGEVSVEIIGCEVEQEGTVETLDELEQSPEPTGLGAEAEPTYTPAPDLTEVIPVSLDGIDVQPLAIYLSDAKPPAATAPSLPPGTTVALANTLELRAGGRS